MLLRRVLPILVLGALLPLTVRAGDAVPPVRAEEVLDPRVLLGGIVTEGDVSLLFAHMRAALRASAAGREPPPMPEALGKRLEAAGSEMQLRGYIAAIALSHMMERAVRDAVRELAPPPRDVH
jgi:hypothetical protein